MRIRLENNKGKIISESVSMDNSVWKLSGKVLSLMGPFPTVEVVAKALAEEYFPVLYASNFRKKISLRDARIPLERGYTAEINNLEIDLVED